MSIQDKFNKANVIYKITKDIDLGGETLTIPEGCVLEFQGGSFSNGTVAGNNTQLISEVKGIFSNVTLSGIWDIEGVRPEWYNDGNSDWSFAINAAIKDANVIRKAVLLKDKIYTISNSIYAYGNSKIIGVSGDRIMGSYEFQSQTKINNIGNCESIIINKTGWSFSLENVVIAHPYKSFAYDGIKVECTLHRPKLVNVSIIYTKKAINVLLKENGALIVGLICENCIFFHNQYGVYIDGRGYEGTWANGNRFIDCIFSYIQQSAIWIHTTLNVYGNSLIRTTFEYIGKGYSIAEYNENGAAAIYLGCDNVYNTAMNFVEKCFFEFCHPVKQGVSSVEDSNLEEVINTYDTDWCILKKSLQHEIPTLALVALDTCSLTFVENDTANCCHPIKLIGYGHLHVDNNSALKENVYSSLIEKGMAYVTYRLKEDATPEATYKCEIKYFDNRIYTNLAHCVCPISAYIGRTHYDISGWFLYNKNHQTRELYIGNESSGLATGVSPEHKIGINSIPYSSFVVSNLKLVLCEDITLLGQYNIGYLNISESIVIEGNNHSMTYNGGYICLPNCKNIKLQNISVEGVSSSVGIFALRNYLNTVENIELNNVTLNNSAKTLFYSLATYKHDIHLYLKDVNNIGTECSTVSDNVTLAMPFFVIVEQLENCVGIVIDDKYRTYYTESIKIGTPCYSKRDKTYKVKTENAVETIVTTILGDTRPETPTKGMYYYDNNIKKPIWWNGSAWVDATGVEV